jgi:hypothetical protein
MATRVTELHQFAAPLADSAGRRWTVFALGARRTDDMWIGWLEFVSNDGRVRVTGRETTQPTFSALRYWATGLEPVYLEGAFERSFDVAASRLPLSA